MKPRYGRKISGQTLINSTNRGQMSTITDRGIKQGLLEPNLISENENEHNYNKFSLPNE